MPSMPRFSLAQPRPVSGGSTDPSCSSRPRRGLREGSTGSGQKVPPQGPPWSQALGSGSARQPGDFLQAQLSQAAQAPHLPAPPTHPIHFPWPHPVLQPQPAHCDLSPFDACAGGLILHLGCLSPPPLHPAFP